MKKIAFTVVLAAALLAAGIASANTTFSTFINALTGKTTPSSGDVFYVNDSSGSVDKKITWSNLETSLFGDSGTLNNVWFTGSRLGVGTSSPSHALTVAGTVQATVFNATSSSATSTFEGMMNVGSSSRSMSPSSVLNLNGAMSMWNSHVFRVPFQSLTPTSTDDSGSNYRQSSNWNLFIGGGGSNATTTSNLVAAPIDNLSFENQGHFNGTLNTFVGMGAGTSSVTSNFVTLVGARAGESLVNGTQDTFIGAHAGWKMLDGYHNTFVGNSASEENLHGYFNVRVGTDDNLLAPDGGHDNVSIGASAATYDGGSSNVFIGSGAAPNSTTGGLNVCVGYGCLLNAVSTFSNTAIGYTALQYATGGQNTAIGSATGYDITTDVSQYRVTNDDHLTLLGFGASKDSGSTLTNSTAVGYNARVIASNQVVLGSRAVTSTLTNGNLGVSTTSPFAKLSVHAFNGDANGVLFAVSSSTQSATTTLFSISNTGTTTAANGIVLNGGCIVYNGSCLTPGAGSVSGGSANMLTAWVNSTTLTATGTPAATAYLATSTTATSTFAGGFSDGGLTVQSGSGYVGVGTTSPSYALSVKGADALNSTVAFAVTNSANAPVIAATDFGRVGIGTTSPNAYLHIVNPNAATVLRAANSAGNASAMVSFERQSAAGVMTGSTRFGFNSSNSEIAATKSIIFEVGNTADLDSALNGTQAMVIDNPSGGNVGIGTTSPFTSLSVSGSAYVTGTTTVPVLVVASTTATSTFANGLRVNGGCVYWNNACLGTTTPSTTIYVDSGKGSDATGDGTVGKPYASLPTAVANTTGSGVTYFLNYGTYVVGAPLTMPNMPVTITGNGSTIVGSMTLVNAYEADNFTLVGDLTLTDTVQTNKHLSNGITVSGNLIASAPNAFHIIQGGTLANNGVYVSTSTTLALLGSTLTSLVFNSGTFYDNGGAMNVTSNTYAAINSTTTYAVVGMGGGLKVSNYGTGGGFNLASGATSTPNEVNAADINVGIGTPTTMALNCGSAASSIIEVNLNDLANKQYQPNCTTAATFISNISNTVGSSTALYFVASSTSQASVFPYASTTAITASGRVYAGSLTVTGITGSTQCLTADASGNVTGTGSACGAGGGGGSGGTFSTSTIAGGSGWFNNYSNNATDVVEIGGSATTSAKFFFDPNRPVAYLSANVGVGTTSPSQALTVAGTVQATNFSATSTTATSTIEGGARIAGASGLTVLQSGLVGINTPSPTNVLQVGAAVSSGGTGSWPFAVNGTSAIYMSNASVFLGTAGTNPIIRNLNSNAGSFSTYIGGSAAGSHLDLQTTNANGSGDYVRALGGNNGSIEIARFRSDGTSGFGSTTPYAALSVHAMGASTLKALLAVGSSTQSATTTLFTVLNSGNVGIGTGTPSTIMTVTAGTSATTTISEGSVGDATSKVCHNTKNNTGGDVSWYFVGTTMVVENNLCR